MENREENYQRRSQEINAAAELLQNGIRVQGYDPSRSESIPDEVLLRAAARVDASESISDEGKRWARYAAHDTIQYNAEQKEAKADEYSHGMGM